MMVVMKVMIKTIMIMVIIIITMIIVFGYNQYYIDDNKGYDDDDDDDDNEDDGSGEKPLASMLLSYDRKIKYEKKEEKMLCNDPLAYLQVSLIRKKKVVIYSLVSFKHRIKTLYEALIQF